jgi:hypothetical protein
MTAAIAAGITGAAAAWGVIHWSIPARLRVASALTHSADSQSESGVRICVDGPDSMRVVEYVGQKPA